MATTDLRAMVNAGLLRAHGRNRGAFYETVDPLRQVGVMARRARRPIDTSTLFDPDAA